MFQQPTQNTRFSKNNGTVWIINIKNTTGKVTKLINLKS